LLQKQGLLEVSRRSARRQRFVILTDSGVEALALAVPLWRAVQAKFLSVMGKDNWSVLRNELERLARSAVQMESSELLKETPTAEQSDPEGANPAAKRKKDPKPGKD
jgi:DNA-binding PadR family transcriptional regulator